MTDPVAVLRDGLRDRYAFERELGHGGMANPELAASLGAERFLREIRLAARFQHPHILSVYGSLPTPPTITSSAADN